MIILVMGVCGSGKSSVGDMLAKRLNCAFAEADHYHPDTNKEKMRQGVPLTDEDRWPWLLHLHDIIYSLYDAGALGVVTCSALRRVYRQVILRGGVALGSQATPSSHPPHNATDDQNLGAIGGAATTTGEADGNACFADAVVFVYLRAPKQVLLERIGARTGHFMPPTLLGSQLATLEEPSAPEKHITIETDDKTVAEVAAEVEERLRQDFGLSPDR